MNRNASEASTPPVKLRQVVIFDGECSMCSRFALWGIRRLREPDTGFLPSQSEAGQRWLRGHGMTAEPTTLLLVRPDAVLVRTDAVLELCAGLRSPYDWLSPVRILPRWLRDAGYRLVARVRRWLPIRKTVCELHEPRQSLLLDNANARWPEWWNKS